MIAQWAKGLDEPIQKSGCLMLCYLWAGWLWALRARRFLSGMAYPTVATVNNTYDFLRLHGSVGEDCYVWKPDNVVSFPWHYWDDCQFPGESPEVIVEKVPAAMLDGYPPAASGRPIRPMHSPDGVVTVDITRWERAQESHFTGACKSPPGYFDPWVRSEIARLGDARSVRRVTLVPR